MVCKVNMHNNNYRPFPIPDRKRFVEDKIKEVVRESNKDFNLSNSGVFAEVELCQETSANSSVAAQNEGMIQMPAAESVKHVADEKRELFYSMRKISRDILYGRNVNDSKTFYKQAIFMKDFEDDYQGFEHFSSYYSSYQQMGYKQLRTYFSWRTQVRRGNITNTSVSYAFLYIYELLNNIGVATPQEGLSDEDIHSDFVEFEL